MPRHLVKLALLFTLAVTAPLAAQRRTPRHLRVVDRPPAELGVRAGYSWDLDAWSVGAQVRLPLGYTVAIVPSADYDFLATGYQLQLNLDAVVTPFPRRMLYAGGGLAIVHLDPGNSFALTAFSTKAGGNLFVGFEPGFRRRAAIRPIGEVRWTFLSYGGSTHTTMRLLFGLNFVLGR